ncbi:IS110 family transposase [Oricola indica]|uniref:IS110 family transposase n=1 Tax=Oricola indica TaxID=2872591 RepID=UPI003CCC0893
MQDAGFPVFCLETRHTQQLLSTRPNKTDRNDAHGIATMMRVGHFKPVHVKSRPSQFVRSSLIGRRQFMRAMLRIENTIRALLRTQGLKLGKIHRCQFSERVKELCNEEPMLLPAIEPRLAARDEIRTQMRKLNNALERAPRTHPICNLFQTIPGVGPLTALSFKATIDAPNRFKRSKLVPAHLELTPGVYAPGSISALR